MRPIRRIVLGIDLGPGCRDVWREGCAVARLFDAELHVVHALEEVSHDAPEFPAAARWAEGRLNEMVRAGRDAGARCSPHFLIRAADPALTLLDAARDLDADLIVIGAGAPAGLSRVIFGNSAEQVVREATTPVWVVRPGRGRSCFDRVVAAVDPVTPHRETIDAAGRVARGCDAHLLVVTIAPGSADHDGDAALAARLRAATAGTAAEALDVEVRVRHAAKAAAGLITVADEVGADLLVMGESGVRGVRRLFERDAVEKVLRVAPCSILRVPAAPSPAALEVA